MSDAFSKLSRPIQQILWDQRWTNLRSIQVDAIHHIADSSDDLVIAASTASGKTEAAFLPILSALFEEEDQRGTQALYIAPLKALINDQNLRLKELVTHTDIPIHRWHGDVSASAKKRYRDNPSGVLLITPESLESCFINYGHRVQDMFNSLKFIVIDELHAFLGDVRGVHLASLLARLELITKKRPTKIGLSATLASFDAARIYLNRDHPATVKVIQDASGSRSMSIGLRAYPRPTPGKIHEDSPEDPNSADGIKILAGELARVFSSKTNLIFSNSRALAELLTDNLNQLAISHRWPRNPFAIHHGSLSKDSREDVEERLKQGEQLSVFCTSTLEMGIDIGNVYSIGQLSPPWSVASLVQRIGRSGRKEGESAILRMYALDTPVTKDSLLEDRLYPQLLRSIALIELMLKRWLEPLPSRRLQLSTFIQQILSILRQTGGADAYTIHDSLCNRGIFSGFSVEDFTSILRSLAKNDLIEQMTQGTLILTPEGERITHAKDFYAAFVGSEDFSIRYREEAIGNLPSTSLPPVGENFILNGRRWKVDDINSSSRIVEVEPTRAKKPPIFMGQGGEIHTRVRQTIHEILIADRTYAYLHKDAAAMLTEARSTYRKANLHRNPILHTANNTTLFPWLGTKAMLTLALCAKLDHIPCEIKRLSLVYHASAEDVFRHLERVTRKAFTPYDLADILPDKHPEKYDEYAPANLLDKINAERMLAMTEAESAAYKVLRQRSVN